MGMVSLYSALLTGAAALVISACHVTLLPTWKYRANVTVTFVLPENVPAHAVHAPSAPISTHAVPLYWYCVFVAVILSPLLLVPGRQRSAWMVSR